MNIIETSYQPDILGTGYQQITLNFPDEYVSDVSIMAMTRDGRDAYGVKLFEAWPVSIGETSLSYSDADTLAAVTVGMEYKYWSPIFNTQGKNGSAS